MLRLRPFGPDDDVELLRWLPDAAALRMFAGASLHWPLDHRQLQAIRDDDHILAWTGWLDGAQTAPARPVAHAELVRIAGDRALIARLIVAPRDRGHGLGRELVEALLAEAARRGAQRVELNVYRDNEAAIAVYRQAGFEHEEGVRQPDDALRMARSLKD